MGLLSDIGLDDVDVKVKTAFESIFPSFDSTKYPIYQLKACSGLLANNSDRIDNATRISMGDGVWRCRGE